MPSTRPAGRDFAPRYVYVHADKALRSAAKSFARVLSVGLAVNAGQRAADGHGRIGGKDSLLCLVLRFFVLVVIPAVLLLFTVLNVIVHTVRGRPGDVFVPFAGTTEFEVVRGQHSRPGLSLVAACHNRFHHLSASVPYWLSLLNDNVVNEIVLVDWASDLDDEDDLLSSLPISREGLDSIRLVRVSGPLDWCAPRAYNLGASLSIYDAVALVDCGYHGQPSLNNFSTFSSKDVAAWFQEPVSLEETENGPSTLRRSFFQAVGGYDDRLCGGIVGVRPDEDLAKRLQAAGFVVGQSESRKADVGAAVTISDRAELKLRKLKGRLAASLVEEHPPASGKQTASFVVLSEEASELSGDLSVKVPTLLLPSTAACNVTELLSQRVVEAGWSKGLGMELHNSFSIPWDIVDFLSLSDRELLLRRLILREERKKMDLWSSYSSSLSQPELLDSVSDAMPRLMVVHVMHGLGNRIRSLTSAMAFAESTGRELVVVWERDKHCEAVFSDLFENTVLTKDDRFVSSHADKMIVLDQFPLRWEVLQNGRHIDPAWHDWSLYNYMGMEGAGALKDAPIADDKAKHIYFKSAYVMVSPGKGLTGWDLAVAQLNRLIPAPRVRSVIAAALTDVDASQIVGVHIRNMKLSEESGIDAIREYGRDDADVLDYWRGQTRPEAFYEEMRMIVAGNPSTRFFVASDSASVVRETVRLFPGRVILLKDQYCDSRSSKCLQMALADMIVLGRTSMVLGSAWSSFTEGASRFGCKKVRMAGIDFAVSSAAEEAKLSPAVVDMLKRVRKKRTNSRRGRP